MLATIPDGVQGDGSVSYNQGWGIDYTLPSSNPSYKYMPWGQFNQLFYDITSAIQVLQQGSPPAFITSAMNGGSPYSYPLGAMVSKSGVNYISLAATNTTTPPGASWGLAFGAIYGSVVDGHIATFKGTTGMIQDGGVAPIVNLYTGGTTTGSANAQVLALLSPATGFSLANPGDTIICTAGYANTGDTTVQITSPAVAATHLRKNSPAGLVALTGGEIVAGNDMILTVDASGTYFILMNPVSVNASSQTTAASPAAVTSTTGKMIGLAGAITPTNTGKVQIIINGAAAPSGGDITLAIKTGTGSAPANGDAATGTTRGIATRYSYTGSVSINGSFALNALVTGLTVGTAYWIDIDALSASGSITLTDVCITAVELP